MFDAYSPEEALLEEVLCESGPVKEIILHNDDVNTFDHVIMCLMEICGHEAHTGRTMRSHRPLQRQVQRQAWHLRST
jgi:ATP-dependent Clp protease adapter protein ClpS